MLALERERSGGKRGRLEGTRPLASPYGRGSGECRQARFFWPTRKTNWADQRKISLLQSNGRGSLRNRGNAPHRKRKKSSTPVLTWANGGMERLALEKEKIAGGGKEKGIKLRPCQAATAKRFGDPRPLDCWKRLAPVLGSKRCSDQGSLKDELKGGGVCPTATWESKHLCSESRTLV